MRSGAAFEDTYPYTEYICSQDRRICKRFFRKLKSQSIFGTDALQGKGDKAKPSDNDLGDSYLPEEL